MPVTISFGGAGLQFPFLMGVVHGLLTHLELQPQELNVHCLSSGCAGALALLLCSPSEIERLVKRGIVTAHTPPLRDRDYFRRILKSMLPSDAWYRLGSRLVLGQTTFPGFQATFSSSPFSSQEELIDEILASCRIPLLTGGWAWIMDGGFSHRFARADENTIVITLKGDKGSDIRRVHRNYFTEMFLPSPAEMWGHFQEGQRAVLPVLPQLRIKVERGRRTEGPTHFRPQ